MFRAHRVAGAMLVVAGTPAFLAAQSRPTIEHGNTLDTTAVSHQSSAISRIDNWKSPVFPVQGDDDRNVDFSRMVGLVQLLPARDVYFELTVIPDDVHESLIHSRWIDIWARMGVFLNRFVWNGEAPPSGPGVKQ